MKKILIVDDDAELRGNLSEILRDSGYDTEEASNGREAIAKAAAGGFDIALLDLIMPGMNGIDVLGEISRINPKINTIMITAFATIENAVTAIKKGARDYISKPFKIEELITTIKRVLEESKFEEDIKKLNFEHTLSSLANPIRRGIIQLLLQKQSMRLMEMTKELGIEDHTKVVFHLKTLKEAGIIEQDREKLYFLTKEGKKITDLLKILETHLSEN
ncbi:MAG TPA: response regulator [Dissulfurispiraceae bacterium]